MADALALPSSTALPGSARLLSDQRLARLARRGDRRAFSVIYQRYHQDLYRYCQAILRNPQEAQDALQNTMVKVLAALPGETREIRLRPWLYRIAHNEAIEIARRRRPTEPIADDAPADAPGPDTAVEGRERLRELLEDLGELPDRQRSAVVMREMAGMSFEEVAAALGTSEAVARQTVYEARLGLQQMNVGREMACADVRRRISDRDGRVLRRRDVRAHLRGCPDCRAFETAIATRKRDLACLAPLPAVASAGLLQAVLGGAGQGASGGGALAAAGGGAAKGASASMALKSAAAITAVAVAGVSGVEISRLAHPDRGGPPADRSAPATDTGKAGSGAAPAAGFGPASLSAAHGGKAGRGGAAVRERHRSPAGTDGGPTRGHGQSLANGRAAAGVPASENSAGNSATPASHGNSGSSHGRDSAPGQAKAHTKGASAGAHAAKPTHASHPAHPVHPTHPTHPAKPPTPPKSSHQAAAGSSGKGGGSPGSGLANGQGKRSSP